MPRKMREMVGGCCVCSDERGWDENPLVYCDGQGCNVAVHQACYGIVTVPTGPWFCRKCESQERAARVVSLIQFSRSGHALPSCVFTALRIVPQQGWRPQKNRHQQLGSRRVCSLHSGSQIRQCFYHGANRVGLSASRTIPKG